MNMLSQSAKHEFRAAWLPHISDLALGHLAGSLETRDPRVLHDDFGYTDGGGCLEVQCMMYHPRRLEFERRYPMFSERDRGYYQMLAHHWMVDIVGIEPSESVLLTEWEDCGRDPSWKDDIETSLLTVIWSEISKRVARIPFDDPKMKSLANCQDSRTCHSDNNSHPISTGEIAKETP